MSIPGHVAPARRRRGAWPWLRRALSRPLEPGDGCFSILAATLWPRAERRRGTLSRDRPAGHQAIAAGPGDVVLAGTEYVKLGDERGCSATAAAIPSTSRHYGPGRWTRWWAGVVPLLAAAPDRANSRGAAPAAPGRACQHRLVRASSGSSDARRVRAPERRCGNRGPRPSPQALPISSRAASSIMPWSRGSRSCSMIRFRSRRRK